MFDFLHKWLGIPPEEQPPNHYRLLGLCVFEDDADVIDAAADKHLAFLHNLANGEHGEAAEDLSNKISSVRLLLLNSARKAQYDNTLREKTAKSDIKSAVENPEGTATDSATQVRLPSPLPAKPAPIARPVQLPRALTPKRQVKTMANQGIGNATPDVSPEVIFDATTVNRHAARSSKAVGNKRTTTRRRRHVSWLTRLVRLSTIAAFVAVLYLGYSIATGDLEFDRKAFEQFIMNADKTEPAHVSPPKMTIIEGLDRDHKTAAKPRRTQPSEQGGFKTEIDPSMEGKADRQNESNASEEASRNTPMPTAESIDQQMLQIIQDPKFNNEPWTNVDPEEQACWFYNVGVKLTGTDNETKRLAYFKLAYAKLFHLQRYAWCFSVIDSIPEHNPGYPSRTQKAGLVMEYLTQEVNVEQAFFEPSCELIEECVRNGEFVEARSIYEALRDNQSINATQLKTLAAIQRHITEFELAFNAKEKAEENLRITGSGGLDHSRRSEPIGVFYCFYADDWDVGLEHLEIPEGKYAKPAGLELASASSIEIAEAWEEVWNGELEPIRKRAIGRRMITNYNNHVRAKNYIVSPVFRRKVENLMEKVFPRGANTFVWGKKHFPVVIGSEERNFGKRVKATVTKGNSWNRSRDLSLVMPNGVGTGEAVAAIELGNVSRIDVTPEELGPKPGKEAVLGFIVDYHTPGGYMKRVFLRFDKNHLRMFEQPIPWNEVDFGASRKGRFPERTRAKVPQDALKILDAAASHTFVLRDWAPRNWDGRVWFMVYMKDAGPRYNLKCHLKW